MRIVLAPDAFKESMTAAEAVSAMCEGVRRVHPDAQVVEVPMADGGEGTAATLVAALGGSMVVVPTLDALGRPVHAGYGLVRAADADAPALAVVEVAAAIGLALVAPGERDPLAASSAGAGLLLRDAVGRGARRVVVGLGGTATNDGGAGLLRALGAVLRDAEGNAVTDDGAVGLARVCAVDLDGLDPRLSGLDLLVACDVTNPLLGPDGATAVYGPQKGVDARTAPVLEAGLSRLVAALSTAVGRDLATVPGSGAAGGLGAALLALGARLVPGVELVATTVGLAERLADADLVLTGEGSVDAQTARGKAPAGVARLAAAAGVPVVAFAGRVVDPGPLLALGVREVVGITPPGTSDEVALGAGPRHLADAVAALLARSGGESPLAPGLSRR